MTYMNMAFQKFLFNGGLMLIVIITITFSIANYTEYENLVNYDNLSEIVPLHYSVKIRFFFKENILFGQCDIVIRISRTLSLIILNSVPVHIIKAVLIDSKNIAIVSAFQSFKSENTLIISLHPEILPDTYTLNITYMHVMYKDSNLYKPVYQDKLGQMLNKTGVEIIKASQLFPYINQTTINSRFKIAIKHDEKYTVLSNMPIRERNKTNNHMIWTDFDESLLMSVEHLSFVITTFTNVSIDLENVTIWCRPRAQKYVLYAKDVIKDVVPYFRNIFMKEFRKLDIVAFRHLHDYNIATLGLILLREADIIYNETLHPVIHKREIAHMIVQQLAFIWCRDVLLWSKEGFVTFIGAYILDQIYKDDHMMDLMVVQAQQDSLRYDTPSTINSSTLSTNISQVISLEFPPNDMKSFIIWRMIYSVIPHPVFWRAIRICIDRHRIHLNMTPDDLWNTMQTLYKESYPKHSQSNILWSHLKEIITNWITKKYYFVLNVTQHFTPVLNFKIEYILSPYLLLNNDTKIWIPVTNRMESILDFYDTDSFWITSSMPYLIVHSLKQHSYETEWIIINIQQTGYYRVKYDFETWMKLKRYLKSENYLKIHILNRAQLIDDAFYFFLQRELSYDLFWNLTGFVTQDTNFVTWYPMIKVFESFTCLYPLEYGEKVTINMKNRINQLLTKIGYTEEPTDHTLTIYLRQEAVKWACMLNVSKCQEVAASEFNKEFQNFAENNNSIGKKWIYCHGLKTANRTIWFKIWLKWIATSNNNYLVYLTCSENYDIICNFLEMILAEVTYDNERAARRANTFFFTIAKYAKTDKVNSYLFEILKEISFSSNK